MSDSRHFRLYLPMSRYWFKIIELFPKSKTNMMICLLAGTTGANCASTGTVTSRPCSSNQCKNGATCYDTSFTQYGCACVSGFFGTYCDQQQTDLGGCSTNPCFNGGTCQSFGTSGSYICLCSSKLSNLY